MARGWVHTVHDADKRVWRNEVEGGDAIRGTFKTKSEAVEAGRKRAQTEHVIHNMNGRTCLGS
jgi:Uncharacterized protein conserved in bacteria (DUF2188)